MIAFVEGFRKAHDREPHGTMHAAFQVSHALAGHGQYAGIHVYEDPARSDRGTLVLPRSPPAVLFQKPELRRSKEPYLAIYVANGEQRSSAPHLLRPAHDWAPVICTMGTAHHTGQWAQLLLALASGAIRVTDGFIFKSRSAESLARNVWQQWVGRLAVASFPAASTVIPNGVDVSVNRRSESRRAAMRARLRLPDGAVVYLAFSRLSPATKGDQQALVVRWRDIQARIPNAFLVLSGAVVDQEFLLELRQLASAAGVADRVLVIGDPFDLLEDARLALMSAADVFIHVSTGVEETSPLVVHEAMAHGLPVIAASWAGVPEVVKAGETGFLLETKSAPIPAFLVESLFGQSGVMHAMGASRRVAVDYRPLVEAAEVLADSGRRGQFAAAARRSAEVNDLVSIAQRHARFVSEVSIDAENAWSTSEVESRPLVDLNEVIRSQATDAIDFARLVRLRDPERAALLTSGWQPETKESVDEVLRAFATVECCLLSDLAKRVAKSRDTSSGSPLKGDALIAGSARLLVRMLNYGLLEFE